MNTHRDLSAEARSAKVDRLDNAIDQVAARMTSVAEDPALADRIIDALPERSAWSLNWWIPRLAITAVVGMAAALVVLRSFDERSTDVLRSDVRSSQPAVVAVDARRTSVEPAPIVRRTTVERPSSNPRTMDAPDFDRSLPALEAASVLTFESLAPVTLPEDAPMTLAPLAIADLPLTAETISPR